MSRARSGTLHPKRILILYANSGFLGHKMIANNYAELLKRNGYNIELADVFEIDSKAQIETGNRLYYLLLQKLPWLWRWLYSYWHIIPTSNWLRLSVLPRRFKKSQQLVLNLRPDLIITTHPIATSIINYLKAKKRISGRLFTTFSDWHTQKFWIFPQVDKYLVVTPQQKNDLVNVGVGRKKIAVIGMLLGEGFYQASSKQNARELLNLPQDLPVILVMGGGKGWGIESVIDSLLYLQTPARVIVIGASEVRRREVQQKLSDNSNAAGYFDVKGFVEPSAYFSAADLLISKPGGLTTSQAFLLMLPLLPISPLPGQEEKNLDILYFHKAVLKMNNGKALSAYVDQLLKDKTVLNETARKAYILAPRRARERVLKMIRYE